MQIVSILTLLESILTLPALHLLHRLLLRSNHRDFLLEHGLRTPTGHIARQTRRIDEIRPRMTVVEEEVSWLRSQFAPRSHQMHQEPDLLQLPVRASMGSLELHSDAMGSARRLRRPCARRIDEVPKGARLPARPMLPSHRASLRAAPATTRLSNTTPPPRARSTSPTPPCGRAARSPTDNLLPCATVMG